MAADMAKLVGVECPHCGAKVRIDPGQPSATCEYCDTTSTVQGGTRPPPGTDASPRIIYVERKSRRGVFGVVGLVLTGLVAGFFAFRSLGASPRTGDSPGSPQVAALGPPPPPADPGEVDFYTGRWTITDSTNPGAGAGYAGVVDITKSGAVYRLAWHIQNTAPYRGVGVAAGDGLGVGWGVGPEYGVAVYDIGAGRLEGRWATESSGRIVGTETLVGPDTLEGTFDIADGRAPNGDVYGGQVVIERRGETFTLRWKLGQDGDASRASYSGVGIRNGDRLVVGWGGPGSASGVVVYAKTGDGLTGAWAHPDAATLGTENLGR